MMVVAVLAVALGGYLEVARLLHQRDEFLRTAWRHAIEERSYRRRIPTSESIARHQERLDRAIEDFERGDDPLQKSIERLTGRPTRGPAPAPDDKAFAEAKARSRYLFVRSRKIQLKHLFDNAEECRKRADYHAALKNKYAAAAARPWLPVAADPPLPR
jgi:hypothetical protein